MSTTENFVSTIKQGYEFKGESFSLGRAVLKGEVTEAEIKVPLATLNRHGLVAGATGTGKTKTLQSISEALSAASVPVLLLDIKGDLSGIAVPGTENEKIKARTAQLGITYTPSSVPAELLSLSGGPGIQLRATVTEFGPVLLSRILGLNDTQSGLVSLIFKYCDDNKLPLLDLKDFTRMLQYIGNEGKKEIEAVYGKVSTTSTGTILRKVIELQQQGADRFFGERSFEVEDLMRIAPDGRGMVSILRVTELMDRPKLFSTFMLQLLAELYALCPEEGDLDRPKLVIFIDEAHLIFNEASPALLEQIETIIKLIRSKGIGVFFCTQNPADVPSSVLSQLGLKIQHALRAFTAGDRKSIKQAAENYPETSFYEVDTLLTELGIGEALVTMLNEKGIPTPLAHVMIRPPQSRMDVLTESEVQGLISSSSIAKKYSEVIDSESAFEILNKKIQDAEVEKAEVEAEAPKKAGREPKEKSILDNPLLRSAGRTAVTMLTRSLLGVLGVGPKRRARRY